MKLAGEMGPLLKIERDLTRAIEKDRGEWEDRLPLFRVGAGSGGGRSSAISRRMSANKCREMATSAIWKAMYGRGARPSRRS